VISVKVERWRTLVTTELGGQGSSIPPELILSIIQQESGGSASAFNSGSKAAGLMQVKPIVVETFNSNNGKSYTAENMLEPAKNLKVGIWLVRHNFKKCKEFFHDNGLTLTDYSLARLALLGYRMGWPATEAKLEKMVDAGAQKITYASFKAKHLKWGWSEKKQKWLNQPFYYVDTIFVRAGALAPIVEFESVAKLQTSFLVIGSICVFVGALLLIVYMVKK